MSAIQMTSSKQWEVTSIPNVFLDTYLKESNPTFVVLFIFLLRHRNTLDFSTQDIAEALGILESDVINGIRYWEKMGLLSVEENDGFSISFLDMREETTSKQKTAEPTKRKPVILETRPQYSTEELELYKSESNEIVELFSLGQQALGKLLSYNDLSVLFGIYDWLRLPLEVIEILLAYCAENGKRNIRYIEKVALDWAENEIVTVDAALEYIKTFNQDYRQILKAFGQSNRMPTASEIKYMDKWLQEYKLPMEIILEACDRTIIQTGRIGYKYCNKILTEWFEAKVTTLEDIAKVEDVFHKEKEKATAVNESKQRQSSKATPKPNRFVNFKQRDWDYDQILMLEQEYLENSANKAK